MRGSDTLLTTAQAAAALGIDASSIRHYVRTGRLPATKHGRDWLIKAADLERLERRAYRRGHGEPGPSLSRPEDTLEMEEERP